jgi:large subunit ribosomal protein L28
LIYSTKIYTKENSMAKRCAITGKSAMSGNNVSHANNETRRKLKVNLRTIRVTLEDGTRKKLKVAASTLRTMRKSS